jgi:hypothetical protein
MYLALADTIGGNAGSKAEVFGYFLASSRLCEWELANRRKAR